jgi:hypothetical protein
MSHVINVVAQHHQSREAEAEGKASPLFRVKTTGPENVGVHESTGQEFDPCGSFADAAAVVAKGAASIEFETGFDKRKMAWAKSDLEVAMEDAAE